MRLPQWARKDNPSKLKFLIQQLAICHGRQCSVAHLCSAAGMHYNTVIRAQENGRMSKRVATALTNAVPDAGIKAIWLIAPELIECDDVGEIRR
jgi:hypothetical protein